MAVAVFVTPDGRFQLGNRQLLRRAQANVKQTLVSLFNLIDDEAMVTERYRGEILYHVRIDMTPRRNDDQIVSRD